MFSRVLATVALLATLCACSDQAQFVAIDAKDVHTTGSPKTIDLPKGVFCEPDLLNVPPPLNFTITKALALTKGTNVTLPSFKGTGVYPILISTNNKVVTDCAQESGHLVVDPGSGLGVFNFHNPSGGDDLSTCGSPGGPARLDGVKDHSAEIFTDCNLYFAGFYITSDSKNSATTVRFSTGVALSSLAVALLVFVA
ncbi:hypothetical protein EXIGLDRAFT_725841 [Exidia glandulosa HHB12029]|uniref:Ubiquitin 3 binding protein But2 C-terminal domain-containing protein n=1 Tax=Exidia glandulosa HHB12029 TaxID=1314781 RepID=A0A165MFX3_EXIGL|nr:hypothetical protein EXIGLDRAFT_725841 [Exidia glandulosa HHB12029]